MLLIALVAPSLNAFSPESKTLIQESVFTLALLIPTLLSVDFSIKLSKIIMDTSPPTNTFQIWKLLT